MRHMRLRRLGALLLAVLIALTVTTPAAAAVSKKVVYRKYPATAAALDKNAVEVKKGKTKLALKKGAGWVRFKAPKTATYRFTVSGLTTRTTYNCGYAYLKTPRRGRQASPSSMRFTTQGGKAYTLYVATKADKSGTKAHRCLKSRTAKVRLAKNQVVYLYFSVAEADTKVNLTIK